MYFRNEHHRQAFRDGMKKTNRKDKETVSAVYLLSAEPCLWRRAKQASVYGKIRSVVGDNGGRIYIARRGKGYQIRHEVSDARRFIGQKSCFVENI